MRALTLPRAVLLAGAALALLLALWLAAFDGAEALARRAAASQREVQEAMAAALRRLKAGEPGALLALWGLCFGYGLLHAAGPGHGKLVLGAYGLGRRVPALRLSALALASSLAQAATAVLLVGGGLALLGWTHERMALLADRGLLVLSSLLIAAIGAWLLWRGARSLRRSLAPRHRHAPIPGLLAPDAPCPSCGHAHGPTAAQAESVRSLREALWLIAAIAARPCTGALFLLILCWRMDIWAAGVAGAFAMGLGVAAVTLAVAWGSVLLRESAFLAARPGPALARAVAGAEALAGALVLAVALAMLRQGL